MANNLLDTFQQREIEQQMELLQYNGWSLLMIELLIQEQESRMLNSDVPVDDDRSLTEARI